MANGYYPPGYFTFHAEGASTNPATNSLHFPGGKSGVTIGPGYDMKRRTEQEIYQDMITIGISKEDAEIIKLGSKLMHENARKFVKDNQNKIKPLTKAQKIMLFKMIWNSTYYPQAKNIYSKVPKKVFEKDIDTLNIKDSKESWDKTKWEDLDSKIIDIIVDLHYQGAFLKRISLQYASSKNDPNYFADCIACYDDLVAYDKKNRKRIPYLKGEYNGPKDF